MSKKYIALGLVLTVMGCQQQALHAARSSTGTRMRSAANSAVNRTVKAVSISDTTSELWNKGGFENKLKSIGSYLGVYKPKPAGSDTEPLHTDSEESSPTLAEQLSFANKFKRSGAEPKTLKLIDEPSRRTPDDDAAEQVVREQEDPTVQTEAEPTPPEAASQVEGATQREAAVSTEQLRNTAAVKIQSTYRGYQSRKQPSTPAAQTPESTRQQDLEPEPALPREPEEPAAQTVRADTQGARQPDSLLADKSMSAGETLVERLSKKFEKVNDDDTPDGTVSDADADWLPDSTTPRTDSGEQQLTLAKKLAVPKRAKDKLPEGLLVIEPTKPNTGATHERFSLSRFTELQGPEKHSMVKKFKELKKKFTNKWDEVDIAVKNTTLDSLDPETRREFEKYLVDPKKYIPPVEAAPVRVEVASPAASAARTADAAESPRVTDDSATTPEAEVAAAASSRPALPPPPPKSRGFDAPAGGQADGAADPRAALMAALKKRTPVAAATGAESAEAVVAAATVARRDAPPAGLSAGLLGALTQPRKLRSATAAPPTPATETPLAASAAPKTGESMAEQAAAAVARRAAGRSSPTSRKEATPEQLAASQAKAAEAKARRQAKEAAAEKEAAKQRIREREAARKTAEALESTEELEAPERTLTMAERRAIAQAVLEKKGAGKQATVGKLDTEARGAGLLARRTEAASEAPDLTKYLRMGRVGVPKEAVIQKIIDELGLDKAAAETLLDNAIGAAKTAAVPAVTADPIAAAEAALAPRTPGVPSFLAGIGAGGLKLRKPSTTRAVNE